MDHDFFCLEAMAHISGKVTWGQGKLEIKYTLPVTEHGKGSTRPRDQELPKTTGVV